MLQFECHFAISDNILSFLQSFELVTKLEAIVNPVTGGSPGLAAGSLWSVRFWQREGEGDSFLFMTSVRHLRADAKGQAGTARLASSCR